MIALGAITNGFFNPANSKAMISMMPREHRGFATAVNHVVFGMGNVLGVAIGGFLMTAAFEVHTGLSGVSLTTDNPVGFVAALNTTFLAVVGLSLGRYPYQRPWLIDSGRASPPALASFS